MLHTLSTLGDVQEIYEWFKQMRKTQPVWFDESSGCWHVFRHADVNTVITDYHIFSSNRAQQSIPREAIPLPSVGSTGRPPLMGPSILSIDPPEHFRYRTVVSPLFIPRALDRLKIRIAAVMQELLDQVRPAGKMDIVADIAYPLPTIVIAEMLGLPISDRSLFKRWADVLLSRQLSDAEFFRPGQEPPDPEQMQRIIGTFLEMADYFGQMLEERKRIPRDDMMSELATAEVDGEHLSVEDAISFCRVLLIAGHVTTTSLLSQAIRCFDEYSDVMEQLRKQPELMPGAIEEVLRYASPVWRLMRETKTDVTIQGVRIPKNTMVSAWLASANRDDEQFPEPERFDIRRTQNHHVAFGHGIHFCLGAPLSRMEASIALPMMLEQLPNLQRVREEPLELFKGRLLFGFTRLPVTFTPIAG